MGVEYQDNQAAASFADRCGTTSRMNFRTASIAKILLLAGTSVIAGLNSLDFK